MTISWQSLYAYPERLDSILGPGYEVLNLGRSATTMMLNGDFPYWTAKEYTDVLHLNPDVIIIKLGTNDAKLFQWNATAYRQSYQQMIDSFQSIPSNPKIILCTPVPPQKTQWGITDSVVGGIICPIIKDLATQNNLQLIDLYNAIGKDSTLFSEDGIHPNQAGALKIAQTIATNLKH